jgi:hypothetical protein
MRPRRACCTAAAAADRVTFVTADKQPFYKTIKIPLPPCCPLPSWWQISGTLQGVSMGKR